MRPLLFLYGLIILPALAFCGVTTRFVSDSQGRLVFDYQYRSAHAARRYRRRVQPIASRSICSSAVWRTSVPLTM